METENAVVLSPRAEVTAADFMPVFTVAQAVERKQMVNQFIGQVLRESEDYGKIPGAGEKKVLLKPGAEKLCSIFGLSVTYAEDKIIEDWTGAEHGGEPLFYYSYRCQLSRGGLFMGEAIGSCNSWESKYRYRWVPEEIAKQRPDFASLIARGGVTTKFEPEFAIDKKETGGQYGKPAEYWASWDEAIRSGKAKRAKKVMGKREFDGWEMQLDQKQFRVPNPDVSDAINTCQKMAQKRALVAAVLVVTNCSDAFTQDMEDFETPAPSAAFSTPFDEPRADGATGPTAPSKRPMPIEILALFEKVQKNIRAFNEVCTELADRMISKAGARGEATYSKVCESFTARYPKGSQDINVLREIMIDLYEANLALDKETK